MGTSRAWAGVEWLTNLRTKHSAQAKCAAMAGQNYSLCTVEDQLIYFNHVQGRISEYSCRHYFKFTHPLHHPGPACSEVQIKTSCSGLCRACVAVGLGVAWANSLSTKNGLSATQS